MVFAIFVCLTVLKDQSENFLSKNKVLLQNAQKEKHIENVFAIFWLP
jgi:hypothetical protein